MLCVARRLNLREYLHGLRLCACFICERKRASCYRNVNVACFLRCFVIVHTAVVDGLLAATRTTKPPERQNKYALALLLPRLRSLILTRSHMYAAVSTYLGARPRLCSIC